MVKCKNGLELYDDCSRRCGAIYIGSVSLQIHQRRVCATQLTDLLLAYLQVDSQPCRGQFEVHILCIWTSCLVMRTVDAASAGTQFLLALHSDTLTTFILSQHSLSYV